MKMGRWKPAIRAYTDDLSCRTDCYNLINFRNQGGSSWHGSALNHQSQGLLCSRKKEAVD